MTGEGTAETTEPRPRFDRLALQIGVGLFLVALLLRMAGAGWGLPNQRQWWSLHPDEPIVLAYAGQINPAEFDFVPGFYNYGTLYLTLTRVTMSLADAYGAAPPAVAGEPLNWRAMAAYHAGGRWLSLLAGAFLPWVVFLILYRRTHLLGAVFGGLACLVAPGLVVHSRFQTVDLLATLFVALALLYALKLTPPEGEPMPDDRTAMRWAALAGLFAGLSAGTKYTGILALVALVFVAVVAWPNLKWRLIGIGVAVSLGVFVVTTPGVILDREKFWADFIFEMVKSGQGQGLVFAGTSPGFLYHLGNLAVAMGSLMLAIGVIGLVRAAAKRHLWAIALVAFAVLTYALIGRAEVKFMRYVFPLIPVLAVGFGWIIGRAHTHPVRQWRVLVVAGIAGLGGFLGGGLQGALIATRWMTTPDPRTQAAEFFRTEGVGKSVGLVEDPWFYTATLYPMSAAPRFVPFEARDVAMRAAQDPRVLRYLPADPAQRQNWDIRLLTELEPDFVVASSFEANDLQRLSLLADPPADLRGGITQYVDFRKRLDEKYEIAAIFGADGPDLHDMMYVRPVVTVWKKRASSTTPSTPSSTTSGSSGAPAATP